MKRRERMRRKLLRDCSTALDHWLHQYAPDMCKLVSVLETAHAMMHEGGTLAYIAGLQHRIKNALRKP